MRMSLLLAREPFGAILEKTLEAYWSGNLPGCTRVRWGFPAPGDQVWQGNVYLNFFCVEGVDRDCFEVVAREFGHARAAWRRGLQAAYVRAAITPPFRGWLSQVRFGVSRDLPQSREQLVIGGNRRIRIIHPRAGRSIVLHKHGYGRLAFDREVNARLGAAAALAPLFFGLEAEGNVFSEEYFVGTPANRLPPAREAAGRQEALRRLVTEVHQPTLRVVSLAERLHWVASVLSVQAPLLKEPAFALVTDMLPLLGSVSTGVALSHGDFQDANILAAGDVVRVIDWETADERSQLYDLATLLSGLRLASDRSARWKAQVSVWLSEPFSRPALLVPPEGRGAWLGHAALWWLEETLLRVEELGMAHHADPLPEISKLSDELKTAHGFLIASR
jgi:hypothetical protein